MKLLLLGDSDIDYWPTSLFPDWPNGTVERKGYSGATLQEVVDHFTDTADGMMLVVCAGENDDDLEESLAAMDNLLEKTTTCHHLIFLGPKLEPWLNDDVSSRKQYIKLSKGLRRRCEKKETTVTFIDCLTMFCENVNVPGALLGGKAKADPKFFSSDQLHLNDDGYRVWKKIVETELSKHQSVH